MTNNETPRKKSTTYEEIKEKVYEIVVNNLGVNRDIVEDDSNLIDDLGADTLDNVEFIMALEEEFDVSIIEERAEKVNTVKDAIDLVYDLID